MYRKNSVRVRSLGGNADLAKKVYSSNKNIERNCSVRNSSGSACGYSSRKKNSSFFESSDKKDKWDEKVNEFEHLKMKEIVNLPAFKRLESESTAEDFAEKINKPETKMRNKTKSFLLARYRKASEGVKLVDKCKIAPKEENVNLDTSLVLEQHQYSQHVCPQRRIIQCKIIKCPKIPFEVSSRKKSVSGMCASKNMDFLIAQTENISEIRISSPAHSGAPESQCFIDF